MLFHRLPGRGHKQGEDKDEHLEGFEDLFLEQGYRCPYPAPQAEDRKRPLKAEVHSYSARGRVQVYGIGSYLTHSIL